MRLDVGSCHRAKVWPREALQPGRWRWRVCQEYAWKMEKRHINELELESSFLYLLRRSREESRLGSRCLLLSDSQVVCGVLAKGRSSSRKLNLVVRRLGGLLLGTHGYLVTAWTKTAENPADMPSRRWKTVKKKFGKTKRVRVRV